MSDHDLPAPLVPADVDCTDLDGFMLNAEKLMASELVALSSHEVIGAALLLWCRAWKQRPAASLPNNDKTIAGFSKLSPARYRKLRDEVLRGFVLCSDGRLYHSTLSKEAIRAYEQKLAFQRKRKADAERLSNWRTATKGATPTETPPETPVETPRETRFVAEGQGQGQGKKKTTPPIPPASGGQSRSPSVTLPTWLEGIKARGEKPISDCKALWDYAEDAGLSREFVALAWREFRDRHIDSGKRYRDWRRTFLNSVRGNWFRLWFMTEGGPQLTSTGQQARAAQEAKELRAAA